jgi:succinyl-diaminopimelate desuccinylase
MPLDVVQALSELVRIPSEVYRHEDRVIRRNYREAAETVAKIAESAGLKVERLELEGGEVPTLVISIPDGSGGKPTVAFVSHYDVVPAKGPWKIDGEEVDPYKPVLKDGRLYGRGAADDKSGIVASIAGLADAKESGVELAYNPSVIVTGDEEVGGVGGARRLVESGARWDHVVIVDSSSEYVSIGASGVVGGWIKVKGRSGHAGYPHLARNAAEDLVKVLSDLLEFKASRGCKLSKFPSPPGSPVPYVWGRFTINILKLPPTEPEKHNRIPGEAWAGFDMRLLPEEGVEEAIREFLGRVSAIAAKHGVALEVNVLGKQRGWYSKNQFFTQKVLSAVSKAKGREVGVAASLGGDDGTFFDERGMDVIGFGTHRRESNIHSEGEFVYLEDIEVFRKFMVELLRGQ